MFHTHKNKKQNYNRVYRKLQGIFYNTKDDKKGPLAETSLLQIQ